METKLNLSDIIEYFQSLKDKHGDLPVKIERWVPETLRSYGHYDEEDMDLFYLEQYFKVNDGELMFTPDR